MCTYTMILKKMLLSALLLILAASVAHAGGGESCDNGAGEMPSPPAQTILVPLDTGFTGVSTASAATDSVAMSTADDTMVLAASIDTRNGNVRTEFNAAGEFPYGSQLKVYHNSLINRRFPAGVGRNCTYNILLYEHPPEWHFDDVRIVRPSGYPINFSLDIDGSFTPCPGASSRLTRLESGGYLLYTDGKPEMNTDGDVCHYFGPPDQSGRCRLVYIKDGDNVVTFTYVASGPAAGELESFTEEKTGRTGSFVYDTQGRLESIVSLDGIKTGFVYNETGDVAQANGGQSTLTFRYSPTHNVTSITDGPGGHSAGFAYGNSARGVEFRNTAGNAWDFHYAVTASDRVVSTTFGPRGTTPSVYEFCKQRLLTVSSVPGQPKMGYSYTADKRYLGSYEF